MRGFSFLITWLVFGIPSSAIAVGIGCFLHLTAITIAALVVAIEAMTVLSGVFCVAAKNADIRMSAMFEGYRRFAGSEEVRNLEVEQAKTQLQLYRCEKKLEKLIEEQQEGSEDGR